MVVVLLLLLLLLDLPLSTRVSTWSSRPRSVSFPSQGLVVVVVVVVVVIVVRLVIQY